MNTVNTEDRSDEQVVAAALAAEFSFGHADTGMYVAFTAGDGHRSSRGASTTEAAAVAVAALTAAGRLREHVNAANDEQTARSIFRAWLEDCGYTAEQIDEIDAERDHSDCVSTAGGWDCGDGEGGSNHGLHDETDEAADLIMFTLEALAGRLLPEGGEERVEWGVADVSDRPDEVWPIATEDRARTQAARLGAKAYSRTITTHTGPWVEVPTTPEVAE